MDVGIGDVGNGNSLRFGVAHELAYVVGICLGGVWRQAALGEQVGLVVLHQPLGVVDASQFHCRMIFIAKLRGFAVKCK